MKFYQFTHGLLTSDESIIANKLPDTGKNTGYCACLHAMKPYLQRLRPVGNPILLHSAPLDPAHFGNFGLNLYQSGTAALAAALLAVKSMQKKRVARPEVLLPAYACPDLISACLYAGVTPVLIDLEPNTCWMQLEHIESAITQNTLGIIAVRFLGIAERMAQLRRICDHHHLYLIEDSAQGFPTHHPATYWQGDYNILSFGRGKPVNLLGGGAVIFRDKEMGQYLPALAPDTGKNKLSETLKYHAKVRLYNLLIKPLVYGMATRMPGLHIGETRYKALHGITAMPDGLTDNIHYNIQNYTTFPNIAIQIHERLMALASNQIIDLPRATNHDFSNPLLRYPILVTPAQKRDQLAQKLQPFGASLMYREPLYRIKGIPPELNTDSSTTPNSEVFAKQLITLPTHTDITAKILDEMFTIIRKVLA